MLSLNNRDDDHLFSASDKRRDAVMSSCPVLLIFLRFQGKRRKEGKKESCFLAKKDDRSLLWQETMEANLLGRRKTARVADARVITT